jgi:hypothetical protein
VTLLAVTEVVMGARKRTDDRLVFTFLDQRDHPSTREMVGYFLSPVAVRFAMPDDKPIAKLLGPLTSHVLDVSERAYVPTHHLMGAAPDILGCVVGASPPGPVFVQLQARAIPSAYRLGEATGAIVASGVRALSEPGLTLKFLPMANGAMDLEVGYESRHFDEGSMRSLMARVGEVVTAIVEDDGSATPGRLLARLGGW